MDSKQIQYILKVAECQNITRAAEQLYMSQPALSNFISKTEEELGAKIFNRGTIPLTLTQAGEHYVKTAKMILALEEGLKKDIENLNDCKEGIIKVGMSDMRATSLLPFVLPKFKQFYPNITIKSVESTSKSVEDNVRDGIVDIGIIPLYDVDNDLVTEFLYEEELLLVSVEELPHNKGGIYPWISVEDVMNHDFVFLQKPGNRIRKAVDAMFLEHGVKLGEIYESSNNLTVYRIATTGMALGIVPESVVHMMNPIKPSRVYSIGKSGFHWNISAIWRQDMPLSGAHQRLIHLLKRQY